MIESSSVREAGASLLTHTDLYVGGHWAAGEGPALAPIDPASEEEIAQIGTATAAQAAAAARAARNAFDVGEWPRMSPAARAECLDRLSGLMRTHRGELVDVIVRETGCPITLARAVQVDAAIAQLDWFVEAAARGPRGGWVEELPSYLGPPVSGGLLVREPNGVVLGITAFNIPILGAVWKIAGALAAGCTTLLFPSPRAPLCSIAFARLIDLAGFPPGAFNLLLGDADVGKLLTESPDIDMVTFTGSDAVGAKVMAQAAGTLKRVVLECGGKSPNIVLPGTDVEAVVDPSTLRFCRNAGQGCGATTRILVHASQYDDYLEASRAAFERVNVGVPMDEETVVGPLIRDEQRARVEGFVERAIAGGASVEAGGGRPPDLERGFYMNPVLLGSLDNDAEICQTELFGPVAVVLPYSDVEAAIAIASASRYGLNANIWGDPEEAVAIAKRLCHGTVTVNGGGPLRPDAPFGGYRYSGIGREGGEEGLLEFLEVKHVQWPEET